MPVLPLDCHLPTQYTTHTIKRKHKLYHIQTETKSCTFKYIAYYLTHCGLVTNDIYPQILVNIGSGNGMAPIRRQAITLSNADLLKIWPSRTNFSEIRKRVMCLKMSSANWGPFCSNDFTFLLMLFDSLAYEIFHSNLSRCRSWFVRSQNELCSQKCVKKMCIH